MKTALRISAWLGLSIVVLFIAAQLYTVVKFALFADSATGPLGSVQMIETLKNPDAELTKKIGLALEKQKDAKTGSTPTEKSEGSLSTETLEKEARAVLEAGTTRMHNIKDPMGERRKALDLAYKLQRDPKADLDVLIPLTLLALQEEAEDPEATGKYDSTLMMNAHTMYLSLVHDPAQALSGTETLLRSGVNDATKKDIIRQFLFRFPQSKQALRKHLAHSPLESYLADDTE